MWHRASAKYLTQRESQILRIIFRRRVNGSIGLRYDAQHYHTAATQTSEQHEPCNEDENLKLLHPLRFTPPRPAIRSVSLEVQDDEHNIPQEAQTINEQQTDTEHSIGLVETELLESDGSEKSHINDRASLEHSRSNIEGFPLIKEGSELQILDTTSSTAFMQPPDKKINSWHENTVEDKEQHVDVGDEQQDGDVKQETSPKVYNVTFNQKTLVDIVKLLQELRELGLPDNVPHLGDWQDPTLIRQTTSQLRSPSELAKLAAVKSKFLKTAHLERIRSTPYLKFLAEKRKLPVNHPRHKQNILSHVSKKDVVILVSETGSGKTTQVPQLLLEHKLMRSKGARANVLCTQPRRMAAISVARRVADEQATAVGQRVGFQVRFFDRNPADDASISYWTAGVLLRLLHDQADSVFSKYSVLVIDEVHERDVTTDLCLTTLRDHMRARLTARLPCPKIVLMSATIDAVQFEQYFAEVEDGKTPQVATIHIPGRNHGVDVHSLDDFAEEFGLYHHDHRASMLLTSSKWYFEQEDRFTDRLEGSNELVTSNEENKPQHRKKHEHGGVVSESLIALMVAHALKSNNSGDVLVFLPGMQEIDNVSRILQEQPILGLDLTDETHFRLYRLHGALYETNDNVFKGVPQGCRRVILATNIAQTSITLPDVVHVVDSGVERQLTFDHTRGINTFDAQWINKATSSQRRGRAGRTQPGHYWMALTNARYASLAEKATPEIQLVDLTSTTLMVKAQIGRQSARAFLSRMMDAPDTQAVDTAISQLQKINMLTAEEELTTLGKFASYFPLTPATSQGLLFGVLFRCLSPLLTVACHNPEKPLVSSASSVRAQMESNIGFAGLSDSDRFAFITAFEQFDLAHAKHDKDEIKALYNRNVKTSAYIEMLNVGRQVYEQLSQYGVVPDIPLSQGNVFRRIPPELDTHAGSQWLVNALAMTMKQSRLAVWDEDLEAWLAKDTPCFLRPFSVNSRLSLKSAGRAGYDRLHGELISYSSLLHVSSDRRPMLVETSSISPLMAILFGGPVKHIRDNIIEIDGWLRLQVNVTGSHGLNKNRPEAAFLVLELRKALDRFLNMAFSGLSDLPQLVKTRIYGKSFKPQEVNEMFQNHPISNAFADGLAKILKSDAQSWDEYTHLTPRTTKPAAA